MDQISFNSKEERRLFFILIPTISILLIVGYLFPDLQELIMGIALICLTTVLFYFYFIKKSTKNGFKANKAFFRRTKKPREIRQTKIQGVCSFCGKKTFMGFVCSYCGNYFCSQHRIPEKHDCSFTRGT